MAGTKKRVQRTLTSKEVNNQYLSTLFRDFIEEKRAYFIRDTHKLKQSNTKNLK